MTRPVGLAMSTVLRAPPEAVWAMLVHWERQPEWMREMRDVRITTAHREGVGVEGVATVSIGGITTRDTVRVSVWEPPRRLRMEHLGWVRGTGEFVLERLLEGGTLVYWTETLHPPLGLPGSIGLRLFKPILRRTFARDLRLLEALLTR